jgi:SagB-type dehydrogenase family enzyme
MEGLNSAAGLLLAPDQQRLWDQVNDTATDTPETTIWASFAAMARAQPQRPAVIAAGRTLTYGELSARATAIGAQLGGPASDLGHGAGGRAVTICVEPGWEQAVAMLAAWCAGLPFHAVGPGLTQPARWQALAEAGSEIVLTQSWLDQRLRWPDGTTRIAVDIRPAGPAQPEPGSLSGACEPGTPACLLAPEAPPGLLTAVSHDALMCTISDLSQRFGITASDRILAMSPPGTDVSVYAMASTLVTGGSVVIPEDIDLRSPAAWVSLMQRHGVTVWHSPPASAAVLAEHLQARGEGAPPTLRLALLGGEPLAPALVTRFRRAAGRPLRMVSLGSCIPAGLWMSCLEVGEPGARRGHVPVGTPLAGKHVYVLGEAMTLCPIWVTGRLYVGGRGLPSGEWAQTEDFTVYPATGEALYRTDLIGRVLPEGAIEVVGESAAHIAVGGHPLNLRDVEAHLAAHEAVAATAVVPAGAGSIAFAKLVAGAAVTSAELGDYLRTKMSPYLLPERVDLVAALALTPSGRIDRTAMSALAQSSSRAPAGQQAPATVIPEDVTARIGQLAARVLGVSDVEPAMNLLDLGATSVQLVRLAVEVEQELGIQVDVEELLSFPSVLTVARFAAVGDGAGAESLSDGPTGPAAPAAAKPEVPAAPSLILDPVQRMTFKDRRPAIRRDLDTRPGSDLGAQDARGDRPLFLRRRTHRTFGVAPVPAAAVGGLLGALRGHDLGPADDQTADPKYGYPSAGSLYPVQTYLTIAPGRVAGFAGGSYYYHPARHRLISLTPDAVVEPADHAWINRAAFRSSAFAIYLVAQFDAITPMYGNRARDYCLIEAGAMCQLLMTAAADLGLGLCAIGEMDTARILPCLNLTGDQELLHSLLGGRVPESRVPENGAGTAEDARSGGPAAEAAMLARLRTLPPDGVRAEQERQ